MNPEIYSQKDILRFWSKVNKTDSCWLWTGTQLRRANGYVCGGFSVRKLPWLRAHNVSYELTNGPIPNGSYFRFKCENTLCVNPEHLVPITMEDRFWQKVVKTDYCWEWHGTLGTGGYGRFKRDGKSTGLVYAHRYSYELHVGPIPNDLLVLHRCDNPPCTNPEHLFLGTDQDNMNDMVSKGRSLGGERSPFAKLTEAQVLEIRASTEPPYIIAARLKISSPTVINIRARRSWKYL